MATYRYLATNLGPPFAKIAELHLSGVSWQRLLNGSGAFSGSLKLPPPVTDLNRNLCELYKLATDRATTCVYVLRDNVPMGAYIIWSQEYDSASQTISITGSELFSYARRRIVEDTTTMFELDERVVYDGVPMYDAVLDALAKINEVGLVLDIEDGGPALPSTIPATNTDPEIPGTIFRGVDAKNVADVITEWANQEDGFDFRTDLTMNGTVFERRFILRSSLGVSADITASFGGLVAKNAVNVTSFKVQRRGDVRANDVIAVGAASFPELGKRFSGRSINGSFVPTMQNIYQLNEETSTTRLDAYAQSAIDVVSSHEVIEVEVAADEIDAAIGTFLPGDSFRFLMPPNSDSWYVQGIDTIVRTIGFTVTPTDTEGREMIAFQLEESPFASA